MFLTMRAEQAFNFHKLVLINAQTMTDTDALLAASLCRLDTVVLTGPACAITDHLSQAETSILHRMATLAS